MVEWRTGAHALLAVTQLGVAVAVHGSVLALPTAPVLVVLAVGLAAALLWGSTPRRSRDVAREQVIIHSALMAAPLLLGDGVHLQATHSWMQLTAVLTYLAGVLSLRQALRGELQLPDASAWCGQPFRVLTPSSPPALLHEAVAFSRRPGCAVDRPFLVATWFRGPPPRAAAPA